VQYGFLRVVSVLCLFSTLSGSLAVAAESTRPRLFYYIKKDNLDTHYVSNGEKLFEVGSSKFYTDLKEIVKDDPEALNSLLLSEQKLNSGTTKNSIALGFLAGGLVSLLVWGFDRSTPWVVSTVGCYLTGLVLSLNGAEDLKESNYHLTNAVNKYNKDDYTPKKKEEKSLGFNLGIDPTRGSASGLVSFSF